MKKMISVMAAAFLGMGFVFAQEPVPPAEPPQPKEPMSVADRIQRKVDFMDARLNLSDEQEDRIHALYTEFANKRMTCQERQDARIELQKEVEKVLTPEQLEIQRRFDAHHGPHGKGRGDCMRPCEKSVERPADCPKEGGAQKGKGPVPPRKG